MQPLSLSVRVETKKQVLRSLPVLITVQVSLLCLLACRKLGCKTVAPKFRVWLHSQGYREGLRSRLKVALLANNLPSGGLGML